jgi:hypothetical protein
VRAASRGRYFESLVRDVLAGMSVAQLYRLRACPEESLLRVLAVVQREAVEAGADARSVAETCAAIYRLWLDRDLFGEGSACLPAGWGKP